MRPYRPGQRVEFPTRPVPPLVRWAWLAGAVVALVAGFTLFCAVAQQFGRKTRDVYVIPTYTWVADMTAPCTGGDTFEVGHVVTTYNQNVSRPTGTPYLLTWRDSAGRQLTYPLCLGGYTVAEAGWALELRAWWADGSVKRVWVVANSAVPKRDSFVLGALDTISGRYRSAYDWRNRPEAGWPARTAMGYSGANPLPRPGLRVAIPAWAVPRGGQLLAATDLPETWNDHAIAQDGVPRTPAGQDVEPWETNWDAVMAGERL